MDQETLSLKLLLMGDSGAGKSSILIRFCDDEFFGDEAATIGNNKYKSSLKDLILTLSYLLAGVDLKIKVLENFSVKPNSTDPTDKKKIKLTIWDTAGQEKFRSLTSSYYRGAQGVILVYDVTRPETFKDLKEIWLKELEIYADLDDLILMVVGNKIDLQAERQVSTEEGAQLAKELSALFMESSAKTKVGIKAIFEELVRKIVQSSSGNKKKPESAAKQTQATVSLIDEDDENNETATNCSC